MQYVDVVVGGQYGSEAKGHVAAQLVKQARRSLNRAIDEDLVDDTAEVWNVRVAGPNAGHTAYDEDGNKFALRTIPVGVVTPGVKLYIAPGSEIDMEVLYGEISLLNEYGHSVQDRLFISRQATIIDPGHKLEEQSLINGIGSTGKGIGAARAARLMRTARTMGEAYGDHIGWLWSWAEPEDIYASDEIVHNKIQHVIVEGTQGYGLSLRASGHYPQVTSSDARSVDFLAMAGIDPTRCNVEVQNWVVARVYPIRVAGNSGPMKGETSWEDLGLEAEKTTVTQKIRRVGDWDLDLLTRAVQANGGHRANIVVTMLDQVVPELRELAGATLNGNDGFDGTHEAYSKALEWIEVHLGEMSSQVAGITFSPRDLLFTEYAFANRGTTRGVEAQVPEEILEAAVQAAMAEIFGVPSEAITQIVADEDQKGATDGNR